MSAGYLKSRSRRDVGRPAGFGGRSQGGNGAFAGPGRRPAGEICSSAGPAKGSYRGTDEPLGSGPEPARHGRRGSQRALTAAYSAQPNSHARQPATLAALGPAAATASLAP